MGCVQTKPSTNSPNTGGSLDKMKLATGYVPARRSTGAAFLSRRDRSAAAAVPRTASSRGSSLSEENGGHADAERGAERKKVAQLLPPMVPVAPEAQAPSAGRGAEEEETDDGWPRWLTDNMPREVLAGMVRRSADSYDKLAKVGQGTYSNVYKARDRDTGKIVALKKVRFDTSETESVRFMAREIMILQKLDHTNVIKLEGLATSRMQCSLYLVFDFMQTDLSRVISRPEGRLTEPQVKCYMHQLLSGLQHCHERGILHRDIKGSNLLIDKQGTLKIGDFGLANYFDPKKKRPLTSRVVTLWYRAPELLLGTTDYGVGIDLWSAGCLLAEMFAGKPIMPGRTEVEQLHRIFKLCGSPSEDCWRKLKLSTSFRPPKPYKPNILETFRDFPGSSMGLLKSLLALDPAYRGSAASALQSEFFTTNPLACELSDLPIVYKEEEDESVQPRRKHRSSKMKQRSRTQKEGHRDVEDIVEARGVFVSAKEDKKREARTTHNHELGSSTTGSTYSGAPPNKKFYSHELGSSTTGSASSGAPPNKYYSHELGSSTAGSSSSGAPPNNYYVKSPSSLSPVNPLREGARQRARHSHELGISTKNGSAAPPAYSYYVSSPLSLSPVSSPLLEKSGPQARHRHELDITTAGSTSSDEEPNSNRYTVSPPTTPSPVKSPNSRDRITTIRRPSTTKNINNLPPRLSSGANVNRVASLRYGMEKRSVSISGSRLVEKKQVPKRYAVG